MARSVFGRLVKTIIKNDKMSASSVSLQAQGWARLNYRHYVPNNTMIPCSLATTASGTAQGFCSTNVDGASVCISKPFTGTQVFQGPSSNLQVNADHVPLGVGMAVCPANVGGVSSAGVSNGGQNVEFFAAPWQPYTQSTYRTATNLAPLRWPYLV